LIFFEGTKFCYEAERIVSGNMEGIILYQEGLLTIIMKFYTHWAWYSTQPKHVDGGELVGVRNTGSKWSN
jgi:hypothetical protein